MKKVLIVCTMSILLAIAANADNRTLNSNNDTFGFSSDDSGGTSYLGVDTRDITMDRLAALHLKEERGVEVTMVDQDAPAGKAGLKEQDVILTMNGTEVESVEQFRRLIRETPPGRVIMLGISRKGQPMNVRVQLADRKNGFAYGWSNAQDANNFHFQMPAMPVIPDLDIDIPVSVVVVHSSMRSGLMVENLTPQLGDFFGAKNGQGVLVRSVEKGSRADKAGFRAGDVIVKINGEAVSDSGDFSRALHSRKDNKVSISILRDRKEQTITLTLPERRQGDLYWESFDAPQIDAKTQKELSNLQCEIAHMKPQMDEAYSRSLAEFGKNWGKQAEEMRKQGDELRKQMREWQRQYTDQQNQSMEKLRKEFQHMENEF